MRTPKFTPQDVSFISQRLSEGATLRGLAQEVGTSYITILKIKKGEYKANERPNKRNAITRNEQTSLPFDPTDSGPSTGQTESHPTD